MPPVNSVDTRSLDARFAGGIAWTAGVKWATQFFTWGSLLILARLLTPSDYGVGEMAGTFTITSNVLAEFGVGTAVLHMPELSRKALGQLHLFSCMMGFGVFALAALAAPLIASFYHTDHTIFFIANNYLLLLTGFEAVPFGLLARDMDYRRLSIIEGISVLVQSAITVLTAWLGWGYWALFAGSAAGRTVATVMVCSWKRIGFAWPRWSEIRAPVELGRQAAIGRIAWSIYIQSDGIVIGRILGPAVLGIYKMAMNIATAPAEKVGTLLMRTASPLFARVQSDRALVRRYYAIVTETLGLVIMPVMAGLAIVAPQAVEVILGRKWLPATVPIQLLSLFMVLRSLNSLTEQVLISQRRTRFTMRMSILSFFVMPCAFAAAANWFGTAGVAAAWIVLSPITMAPLLIVLLRHIEMPGRDYFYAMVPAAAGTGAMSLAVLWLRHWLQPASLPPAIRLGAMVALGAAVYAGVLFGFFRARVMRYINFVLSIRKGRADAAMPEPECG